MIVVILTAVFVAVCIPILLQYIHHLLSLKRFPPGPLPLPIIGNLHQLKRPLHVTFSKLAEIYGDVYSFSLGARRVIVVNGIVPAKEALITKSQIFAGRDTNSYMGQVGYKGCKDIAFADYHEEFIRDKKVSQSALRVYGDSSERLRQIIVNESEELHKRLKTMDGMLVNINEEIGMTVMNIIMSIVFNERFSIKKDYQVPAETIQKIFKTFENGDIFDVFPWLRYVPLLPQKRVIRELFENNFIKRKVSDHIQTYDEGQSRGFADILIKYFKSENGGKLDKQSIDKIELLSSDLITAGYDTTTSAMSWIVLFLVKWPEYQHLLHGEIKMIIGDDDRYPTISDRPHLHLARAFIYESQRLGSVSPLGIPHKAMKNNTIAGYPVPEGTQIFFNHWFFNHDPNYWENPFSFDLTRWLDDKGKFTPSRNPSYLPFSAGKRVCPGEAVAKTELLVLLSRFVKDFRIEKIPTEELPDHLETTGNLVLSPLPFNVIIKTRN